MQTKLTTMQVESHIREIYTSAQACRMTSSALNVRIAGFLAELNSRTESGRRRYSVEFVGYARGFAAAHDRILMQEQVEFVYRDKAGAIFSTWRQSAHRSTEEFYDAGRGIELGEMEAAHVWKGTDKPFTAWTVPNRESEKYAARKAVKEDKRYSVTREWMGAPKAQWVVRFCDEWLNLYHEDEQEAWNLAATHSAERQARITS